MQRSLDFPNNVMFFALFLLTSWTQGWTDVNVEVFMYMSKWSLGLQNVEIQGLNYLKRLEFVQFLVLCCLLNGDIFLP